MARATAITRRKVRLNRGIDWSKPKDQLAPGRSVVLRNYDLIDGRLKRRRGFRRLRYNYDGSILHMGGPLRKIVHTDFYSQDFEALALGALNGQGGWVMDVASPDVVAGTTHAGVAGQFVDVNTGEAAYRIIDCTATTQNHTFWFYLPTGSTGNFDYKVYSGAPLTGTLALWLRVRGNMTLGTIQWKASGVAYPTFNITRDAWHRIRLEVNRTTSTYNAYVDDMVNPVYTSIPLEATLGATNYVYINGTSQVYFDDITVWYATATAVSTTQGLYLGYADRPTGGEWLVASEGAGLFKFYYDSALRRIVYDTDAYGDISALVSDIGGQPLTSAQFGNYTVFSSPECRLQAWDGTSVTKVPTAVEQGIKARMVFNFANRMFCVDVSDGAAGRVEKLIKYSDPITDLVWGQIKSITVDTQGSGYTAPVVTITGGGGTGATATADLLAGCVAGITMTNVGSGYYYPPTVTITDPTGSNAAVTAVVSGPQFYSDNWLLLPSNENPTAGYVIGRDQLLVFTENECWSLTGYGAQMTVQLTDAHGCVGPKAICATDAGLVYINGEDGPVVWDGGSSKTIADEWWRTVWWPDDAGWRQKALVSWHPALCRAWFSFPIMAGGEDAAARLFCWWPNASVNYSENEWTEYTGIFPMDAAYGPTENNQQALLFIDDFGFPNEMDYGWIDGFYPFMPYNVTYSGTPITSLGIAIWHNVTPPYAHEIYAEEDALAGLYLWTDDRWSTATDATAGMKKVRILANTEQTDGQYNLWSGGTTLTISGIDTMRGASNYQLLGIGMYISIWESAAFDMGDPERLKIWHDVYLEQSIIEADSLAISPSTDWAPSCYMSAKHDYADRPFWDETIVDDSPESAAFADARYNAAPPAGTIPFWPAKTRYLLGGEGFLMQLVHVYHAVNMYGGLYFQALQPFEIGAVSLEAQYLDEYGVGAIG